jgi:uncharacterized protein YbbC (DUF1343 family)
MSLSGPVRTGLAVLRDQAWAPLRGLRVGLVTHAAAVDESLRNTADLIAAAPDVRLSALFGPEHGLTAAAQDLISVAQGTERGPSQRVYSLYGDTFDTLKPTPEMLQGLDALVIDLQDVGSRYYTFPTTMLFCMQAAGEQGLRTYVLDRPNPIGGDMVEGPYLRPAFQSFVGWHRLPIRHGLTVGEMARLYQAELAIDVDLHVVPCQGWRRDMDFEATGLPWVLPSPNMPTVETAFVYPGQCLIEGTNQSEGRGTTRPFELCGGPDVDAKKMAERLESEKWPGVLFRPVNFRPTFQKWAGRMCGGVQLHVTDRRSFQPVRVGLAVVAALRELAGPDFAWRTETYEFVSDRLAIDLLFGSQRERGAIEAGQSSREIARSWDDEEESFRRRRKDFLIYE